MNSRERVLKTLQHEEPDCVPYNLRPSEDMRQRLRNETDNPNIDFAEYFNHDVRYVGIVLPECPKDVLKNEWIPQPTEEAISGCAGQTKCLHDKEVAVCGAYACGVFEQVKDWFGDVETFTMPYDNPERLNTILNRITEWKMSVYGAYTKAGVDIVWIGDDLGAQQSLIMSPKDYRQWYKPYHKRIVDHIRKIRFNVRIAFHCCGHVTPLIPDLIDIGVDILEAVQAEAMDIAYLKQEFGSDISFWGGIGLQSVLTQTTPEEVMEGVQKTLSVMAPGGGYIAAPCHTLTDDVPWENVVAFHKAMRSYSAYHNIKEV